MEVGRVILLVIVGLSAAIDLRTRRIPNFLTFGGAAVAFGYSAWIAGWPGLGQSLAGWGVGISLFLPMFLLRGMGAGDVKLLGAVGAWLGPMGALWAGLYSVFAGGVLGIIVGAYHGYLGKALRNVWSLLGFWRVAGIQPLPGLRLEDASGPRLAYGVAIAAGTVAVLVFS